MTFTATSFALVAFAANSVLCRLALGEETIDAASFTSIRLLSGALVLFVLASLSRMKTEARPKRKNWTSAFMLFLYAVTFSFAYIRLDTGTGALILFGAVQLTMILMALMSGERLHVMEWIGMATAFGGFLYLVFPSVRTPSFFSFLLMTVAGIAWAVYTMIGKGSKNPLADTAGNFLRTVPFVLVLVLATLRGMDLPNTKGIILAIASGAIASGLGYVVWYTALRGLTSTQAAVAQLLVPVLAAFGGVVLSAEVLTSRLVVAALLILGGISLIVQRRNAAHAATSQ